jgi:hypothetical protein
LTGQSVASTGDIECGFHARVQISDVYFYSVEMADGDGFMTLKTESHAAHRHTEYRTLDSDTSKNKIAYSDTCIGIRLKFLILNILSLSRPLNHSTFRSVTTMVLSLSSSGRLAAS